MKRFVIILILVCLAAVAVMGQVYSPSDYAYAVRTSTLTRTMLEDLELPEAQIQEILALQNRYTRKEALDNQEIGEFKRKIAEEFNSQNANLRRINRWLRAINEIRLDLDIAKARLYQETRNRLGEARWIEVVRGSQAENPQRIRTEEQLRTQTQTQTRTQTPAEAPAQTQTRTQTSTGSGNSEPSSGSSKK